MSPSPAPSPRTPIAHPVNPGPAKLPSGAGQPATVPRPGGEPELAVVAVLGYN
jgi:hypothetical protein